MYTRLVKVVFVAAMVMFLDSGAAQGKTLYVEKWGDDASDCSRREPCFTIGEAIDKARRNDRIVVGPGQYPENLQILSNDDGDPLDGLKLESSAGRFATSIEPQAAATAVVNIGQPRVGIGRKGRGFSIEKTMGQYGIWIPSVSSAGIRIEGNRLSGHPTGMLVKGDRLQVRDNVVESTTDYSIRCNNCTRALIQGNHVSSENDFGGISLEFSQSVTVQYNRVLYGGGIWIDDASSGIKVKDNVSAYNPGGPGIRTQVADGFIAQGNIATFNEGSGVHANQSGPAGKPIQIKNNLVSVNRDNGMALYDLVDALVNGNTAADNNNYGFNLGLELQTARILNNSTWFNDDGGTHCGIYSFAGVAIGYVRHYRGGGDINCGDALGGSERSTPGPLRVNRARQL